MSQQPIYYFSFRSPYSWIASIQLKNMIHEGELTLVPFWEPDQHSEALLNERGGEFHYRPMSDAKHRYILNDIRRLTKNLDLTIRWPIDQLPWWDLSHLAYIQADQLGIGLDFFWQIYRYRWELGQDISKIETLQNICQDLKLPQSTEKLIISAPQNIEIRNIGADYLYQLYRNDVFGVPMFQIKRQKYWGIDRMNTFLSAMNKPELVQESQDQNKLLGKCASQFDHAGGCG